ncbi:MAG: thioesterase domain-containing protein [Rhodanobacteraceae bacterium]
MNKPVRVIVLHGLWMRGLALSALVQRLHRAGMQAEAFDFMSVQAPVEKTVEELRARLRKSATPLHLVGHSLGGLLALNACEQLEEREPGRIVCLGSPLTGSAAARQLDDWGGGRLLGHSVDLLLHGTRPWVGPRQAGVVAGTLPLGLGALLAHPAGDHDGTVSVAETRLPGLTDHCLVASSHTGLLFSASAAQQTIHFLRHGRFQHPAA